jgi:predicted cupin superfamily sugar epimerase
MQAQHWIEHLALLPHPEGGFYRETYRASRKVQSPHHQGGRTAMTSIYYLLADQQYSAWHRVASDESWFFHAGVDLNIHCLLPAAAGQHGADSQIKTVRIGPSAGQFGTTIPADTWFAAQPAEPSAYTLVSCVVAPGFEFADFELATQMQLCVEGLDQHPQWPWIQSLLAAARTPA